MAQIYPFRALRYNPAMVRVSDVVTQPYDKITPEMQEHYYRASDYNLVRLILGKQEPTDDERRNVYTRAASYLHHWRSQQVLIFDDQPALFAYSQEFLLPGTETLVERRGFIGLGKIHDYEEGVVYRHEHTLSKPKSDRLNLLRATRTHFGQIFMLYSDPAQTAENLLFGKNSQPTTEIIDEYGVLHRMWKIDDPETIEAVSSAMADKKLIIADGHHRYETALNYRNERGSKNSAGASSAMVPPFPEAAVMMTFVNMDSPNLAILPTHRVIFGLGGIKAEEFALRCMPFFHVGPVPHADVPVLLNKLNESRSQHVFAAVFPETAMLLTTKPAAIEHGLPNISQRQKQLDVVQLHQIVLGYLLKISPEAILEQRNIRYLRDAEEAAGEVRAGKANVAFLMNPVRLEQMRDIAFAGEVMPQKSTDFYPKLLSGLAAYALE